MSLAALQWSFSIELPSSQKLTLLSLANHANDSEATVWLSVETIRRETGLNDKTIRRALDELVANKVVTDTGRRMGATRQVPVYQFRRLPNLDTFNKPKTPKRLPKGTQKDSRKTGERLPKLGSESGTRNQEPVISKGEEARPILKNELEKMEDWKLRKDLKELRRMKNEEPGVQDYCTAGIVAIKAEMKRRGMSLGGRRHEWDNGGDRNPRNVGVCKGPTNYPEASQRKLEQQEQERKAKQAEIDAKMAAEAAAWKEKTMAEINGAKGA